MGETPSGEKKRWRQIPLASTTKGNVTTSQLSSRKYLGKVDRLTGRFKKVVVKFNSHREIKRENTESGNGTREKGKGKRDVRCHDRDHVPSQNSEEWNT